MRKFVQANPEAIHVASEYKKVGSSFEMNRQRVANVIYSINRTNNDAQQSRIEDLVGTDGITDAEKPALARELDALKRDFEYLGNDTRNADLGDSDEYRATKDAYDRVVDLMTRIINSVGTYNSSDVNNLSSYYNDYTSKATALENLILQTTADIDKISAYYAKTKVGVNIYPEAVPANSNTQITASIIYEGDEKVWLPGVLASNISFGLTGLSNAATSSMFILDTITYPEARVTITQLTNSAVVENCKEFGLSYSAIGENGVNITISVNLDSDSMPF